LRGRQDVINSFKEYPSGDYEDASELVKEQVRVMSAYGVPADDIACQRAAFDIALLSNTAPTAFWTLFNIFSRSALLQELRAELEQNAVISSRVQNGGNSEFELDTVAIKTKCPLFLSVFQETQRTLTIHANIRKVLEDTTLEGHRLQKGSYVQIPNAPIHNNAEL
jgi:cytochrome P450